jgi:hypothetical protein
MKQISIPDLASFSLPDRGKRGMIAMLECYLDDSGTHEGSLVVVWGGVVGHKHYMDRLDVAWRKQLQQPCEGRGPIKKFSSYDLQHGDGEFAGYNQGEKDRTRRNFRQVIVDCELTVIAFGVSARDWEQVMHRQLGMLNLTAEQAAFGQAIKEVLACASVHQDPVTLQFDQGRSSQSLLTALGAVMDRDEYRPLLVNYGFSYVEAVPALQAADLVVYESYRHFVDRLGDKKAKLNPHTEKLFMEAFNSKGAWLGRREIADAAKKTQKKLRALTRRGG